MQTDRYAIYLRKSRADLEAEKLGEGETLARHKKILTEFAARRGLYVEKIYQEIVSGAESIKDRKEIQELINDCYAGKYRGILIIEVTRLSRGSQADAQIIMDCLKYANRNNGLLVITPTKVYDVAHNADDEEYMEFELFMSRREYKMIKRRMDRGRSQAVVEGNYMGSYRPYGYNILKTKTARTLIPNELEAPIVKQIFDWTVKNNLTPGKIARQLTDMGVPTYTGEPEWNLATIKTILTNPTYCGKVKWNDRMRVKTMVDGELVTSRPRSNHSDHYMEFDGKHKQYALVDEDTFRAAASRFHADKTKSGLKLINPLAGLLVCKKCGKTMAYQPYNTRPETQPRYIHRQSQTCKVKSAYAELVIECVCDSLKAHIDDFEVKVNNLPTVNENTIKGQVEALESELKRTEKKLSKLFDAWEEEKISDNEFVERKTINTERIESIKKRMANLRSTMPQKQEYEEKILLLSDALKALNDENLDAELKNMYLKRVVEKIEFVWKTPAEFSVDLVLF